MSTASVLIPLIPVLVGAGISLCSVWLSGWLSARREREKRRTDSITRKVSEFYWPLMSISHELQARERLAQEIVAADSPWDKVEDSKFKDSEIKILREKTMPSYWQMAATFRDKGWLAERETRSHYEKLLKSVEITERCLKGDIPDEVYMQVRSPTDLKLFYDHLAEIHDRLQRSLVEHGTIWCCWGQR